LVLPVFSEYQYLSLKDNSGREILFIFMASF